MITPSLRKYTHPLLLFIPPADPDVIRAAGCSGTNLEGQRSRKSKGLIRDRKEILCCTHTVIIITTWHTGSLVNVFFSSCFHSLFIYCVYLFSHRHSWILEACCGCTQRKLKQSTERKRRMERYRGKGGQKKNEDVLRERNEGKRGRD